jgi:hypothetical protein
MIATPKKWAWMGIALILAFGLIHLIEAPDSFEDATYKGLLFVANGIAAAVAAAGIYRGARLWGWGLGAFVAAASFIGYVISRTVGLPGIPAEEWLEASGIASLVVEAMFVALAIRVRQSRAPEQA